MLRQGGFLAQKPRQIAIGLKRRGALPAQEARLGFFMSVLGEDRALTHRLQPPDLVTLDLLAKDFQVEEGALAWLRQLGTTFEASGLPNLAGKRIGIYTLAEAAGARAFDLSVDGFHADLRVVRFEAEEAISELFQARVELASRDRDLAAGDLVGRKAALRIGGRGVAPRYIHGMIARFEELGSDPARAIQTRSRAP